MGVVMRLSRWAVAVVAAAIASAACAATFPLATYDQFKVGVTTKAEVKIALGPPFADNPSQQGYTALIYDYPSVTDRRTGKPIHAMAAVLFDPADKFVRYRVYVRDAGAQPSAPSP
jgi:hypothetical protein